MQFLLLLGAIVYADHSVLIDFENRIETCIAKEKLWNELEIAMYRSEDTWLWPNESSVVKGEGLLEACIHGQEAPAQVALFLYWLGRPER